MSSVAEYPSILKTAGAPPSVWLTVRWWAVVSRFLVHGLIVSTWVSRIPAVKAATGLSDGALGLALLGSAVGSLGGIPLSGWAVGRFGSRHAATWTNAGFSLALLLPALAGNGIGLFLALLVFGAMAGADDVAMNSQAVVMERIIGEPAMSRFHGMFSFGGIVGAGLGALIARQGVGPVRHMGAASLLILLFSLASATVLPEAAAPRNPVSRPRLDLSHISLPLLILSAVGFCIFLSEGAIADWTAVYLKQTLRADAGTASAGYAVFSAAMFTFRLAGDWITTRLGRAWTIRGGALLAASGLGLALFVRQPLWAMPGLAMAGAGYSSIIPLVFAAGGRVNKVAEGAGVATVSGLGYLGFLAGPPAIGFVSELTSLRTGLCLVVALTLLAGALVTVLQRLGSKQLFG